MQETCYTVINNYKSDDVDSKVTAVTKIVEKIINNDMVKKQSN